jgi:Uma2 family endonuclease
MSFCTFLEPICFAHSNYCPFRAGFMTTAIAEDSAVRTAALKPATLEEFVERLGGIPLTRILVNPPLTTATEADLIEASRKYNKLFELVDGVLVEKGMAYLESLLALLLGRILLDFVEPRNLGLVSGADGSVRLFPGLVRVPDVAFASWDRFPDRKIPNEPIPSLVPDLVIEVLSASNTKAEMERKRGEYFSSGVRLIWEFEPVPRTVTVYTPDGRVTVLGSSQTLDGADVLVGFSLQLGELFSKLEQHG